MADEYGDLIATRDVTVGVVGLGYVGLPLAIGFAENGFRTIGFDVDAERADALNSGQSYIDDISAERVAAMVEAGRFEATASPGTLGRADALFICVPTPFDKAKTPDLGYVREATETVATILQPGMLVILQSTTYPGTTTEVVQPVLEENGLRAGVDFHLAFSPERVDPGNVTWTVHNTPKVVGGVTPTCTERARLLLESVMDEPGLVRPVGSPAAAEMAKLLENTYRAVNIALVNELAMLAHEMKIDVWEVIDAAASKPFGFEAFYPGIGPGGHCIPVDPHYLSWRAREFDFQTKFIELAADVNAGMARYVVTRIQAAMNAHGRALRGARVLCLGAAFKANVSDIRNSRAIRVMEMLEEAEAIVEYSDPLVSSLELHGVEHKSRALDLASPDDLDLVVVLVHNDAWDIDPLIRSHCLVFDAVNALGTAQPPNVERL